MSCSLNPFRGLFNCVSSSTEAVVAMTSAETIRGAFLPLNKNEQGPHGAEFREEFCDSISGTTIRLRTVDGVELDAVWSPSQRPDAATVILTHGNGSSLDGNAPFAAWYHNRGFNVLLYTMRGYPGSGGDAVKDGEIGCYADMHAAVRFALANGASRDKLLFHGYSFGGATAAAGAHFFGGHLTLDHTFTKPAAVAQNLLQSESSAVPFCITKGAIRGTFPKGAKLILDSENSIPNSKPIVSDGFHTLAKLRKLRHELFVFYGKMDHMMPTRFADELYTARYGAVTEENKAHHAARVMELEGGHCEPFVYNRAASEKYEQHLASCELL